MIHELKTWPESFAAIKIGTKRFDLRPDDRAFAVGDRLKLKEWEPTSKKYTGRELSAVVLFVMRHAPEFGLTDGFVAMSIDPLA